MEIMQSQLTDKRTNKKNESTIFDLWDANLRIIEIPEGEEREKGIENSFGKIIAENLLN